MPEPERIRLQHMLDAAQKAVAFANGRTRQDLTDDEMFMLAEVRLIEIIGEAATAVSDSTRQQLPDIPWRPITATRNRLIHGYFNVDLDILWSIIQNDLPPLITTLQKQLPTNNS
jgi:uncharacterized protein with HEPN domain